MKNAIQLCAKMYDARDTMRRFWSDKYATKIDEWRPYIEKVMARDKCDTIPATMTIIKLLQEKTEDSGMSQALVLACCVEMIEPSKETLE